MKRDEDLAEPVSGVEPLTCRLQDGRPFRSTVIPRSPEQPAHLRFRWSVTLQHHSNAMPRCAAEFGLIRGFPVPDAHFMMACGLFVGLRRARLRASPAK